MEITTLVCAECQGITQVPSSIVAIAGLLSNIFCLDLFWAVLVIVKIALRFRFWLEKENFKEKTDRLVVVRKPRTKSDNFFIYFFKNYYFRFWLLGLVWLPVKMGPFQIRQHHPPDCTLRQGLDTGHHIVWQVSTEPGLGWIKILHTTSWRKFTIRRKRCLAITCGGTRVLLFREDNNYCEGCAFN